MPNFNYANSTHKYTSITVFTSAEVQATILNFNFTNQIIVDFKPAPLSYRTIKAMITHELGHAIGLMHHNKTLSYNFDSVMVSNMGSFSMVVPEINYNDLAAVVTLYGPDGFKCCYRYPIPDPYGS